MKNVTLQSEGKIEHFDSVEKLGFPANGLISFGRKGGGGWTTVLPISPASYRAEHPTNAKFKATETAEKITFNIIDDWGKEYIIVIRGDEMQSPAVNNAIERILAPTNKS